MPETYTALQVKDLDTFKKRLLKWADQFKTFLFLDSNHHKEIYSQYEFIIGVDVLDFHAFDTSIDDFEDWKRNDFVFGHFNYEFRHKELNIISSKTDEFDFGTAYFFKPRYIVYFKNGKCHFNRNYPETFEWLEQINSINLISEEMNPLDFEMTISKEEYISNIHFIQKKIKEGAFYEMNYCIEYAANESEIDPINYYNQLNQKACAPMSALYKKNKVYALSVSPERYLATRGNKIISQPIKGTAKRDINNKENDQHIKENLTQSIKERAENMMIVDLVRNDLSKEAHPGSIKVEELCVPYTFNFVHQLISTITAQLKDKKHQLKALLSAYPAGSMTGAPKLEVMKHIDEIEKYKRGLYSGALGYINPENELDFNVVIRTLFYNSTSKKCSIKVGGAITLLSVAEEEFEECKLKAKGLIEL